MARSFFINKLYPDRNRNQPPGVSSDYLIAGFGFFTIVTSFSMPVFTTGSTWAYSGSSLPVKITNTWRWQPGCTASIRGCLLSRQASTINRRTRWRCTELRNFFLGTENPTFSGQSGIGGWESGCSSVVPAGFTASFAGIRL